MDLEKKNELKNRQGRIWTVDNALIEGTNADLVIFPLPKKLKGTLHRFQLNSDYYSACDTVV